MLRVLFLCVFPALLWADDSLSYSLGLFVDTYYAYDFNRPATQRRDATSQAYYDHELNINLAYLEYQYQSDTTRGRFAAQYGDTASIVYKDEEHEFLRHVQELYVGRRLTDSLWLDVGIFHSHLGPESWISRKNPTYSRSLIADYSPYYQMGVRASYEFSDQLKLDTYLMRGWQNISEDRSPALGTSLQWIVGGITGDDLTLTHNTFIGHEDGARVLNDFVAKYSISPKLRVFAAYDIGYQSRNKDRTNNTVWWNGFSVIGQYDLLSVLSVSLRAERFNDPANVLAEGVTDLPFRASGVSATIDIKLGSQLMWRNEYRALISKSDLFQDRAGTSDTTNAFMSSLSLNL